jgi:acid-sensing ion channel, other
MRIKHFFQYTEFRVNIKSYRTDDSLRSFSPEKRKCFFEGEKVLRFFKTYSKALCEWECMSNKTLEKCGCAKFSMPRDANTPVCNASSLTCVDSITTDHCDCLSPCVDVKYTYQLDKTHFNRDFYREFLPDK